MWGGHLLDAHGPHVFFTRPLQCGVQILGNSIAPRTRAGKSWEDRQMCSRILCMTVVAVALFLAACANPNRCCGKSKSMAQVPDKTASMHIEAHGQAPALSTDDATAGVSAQSVRPGDVIELTSDMAPLREQAAAAAAVAAPRSQRGLSTSKLYVRPGFVTYERDGSPLGVSPGNEAAGGVPTPG